MKIPDKKRWLQWYLRVVNQRGSPSYVARGVAIGLFCAFVIPFGQMALALGLALLFRAARVPAVLFTWVSNPFTIPVIYPIQCYVGQRILQIPVSYEAVKRVLADLIHDPSLESFKGLGTELIIPFFLGGAVLGLIAAAIGFFVMREVTVRFRARRERRRAARRGNRPLGRRKKEAQG